MDQWTGLLPAQLEYEIKLDNACPQKKREMETRVKAAKTTVEQINITYDYLVNNNLMYPFSNLAKRDNDAILSLAHNYVEKEDYQKALEYYTQSAVFAKTTPSLALAYAGRSNALIRLGLNSECVMDCERALKCGYPKKLRPILIRRKRRAMEKISDPDLKEHEDIPIIPERDRNASIPSASSSIQIRRNERDGHHIVAARDIDPGEVLLVEQSYCSLICEQGLDHCHHCLKLCYNPIPCDNCVWILFCCEDCKRNAREMYHKYECAIVPTILLYRTPSVYLFSLRMMFRGFEEIMQDGDFDDRLYRSDRIKQVIQFITEKNKNITDESCSTVLKHIAQIYHLVITHTNFLKHRQSTERDEFKKYLFSMYCTYTLFNGRVTTTTYMHCKYYGMGMYPILNFFGHSCCPNVHKIFYGSTLVLRAMRFIKKDEQCCPTYGPVYYDQDTSERRIVLEKSFRMECFCTACEEEWPTLLNMKLKGPGVSTFRRPLEQLKMKPDVTQAKNLIPEAVELLKGGEILEPSVNFYMLTDAMRTCYGILGNKN